MSGVKGMNKGNKNRGEGGRIKIEISLSDTKEEKRLTFFRDMARRQIEREPTIKEIQDVARAWYYKKHCRDLVSLDRFAAMHNVAPLDVTRAINMQVLRADEVTQDDGTIVLMLDSEGRRAFWEALHDAGTWTNCPICPHELF